MNAKSNFGLIVVLSLDILISPVLKAQWQKTSGLTGPSGGDITAITTSINGHLFAISRGVGLFRSTDEGLTWTALHTGLDATSTLNSVECDDSGYVYLCSPTGLYSSSDDGINWKLLFSNPMSSVTITAKGTVVVGDLYYPLCYRSTDRGMTWVRSDSIPALFGIISLASKLDGDVFVMTQRNAIFRSTTDGQTWSSASNGILTPSVGAPMLYGGPIYIARNGDVFSIVNFLVYRSSDDGDHWKLMTMTTPSSPVGSVGDFSCFLMTEDGNMFAGNYAEVTGIERSTDNGSTWAEVNNGLTEWWIECIAADSDGNIYAGTGGSGVFKSTNEGDNWNASNEGLSRSDVQSIATNLDGDLFAGTAEGGIYRSTDQGQDWVSINNGIGVMNVTAVVVDKANIVFAGTMGAAGIYRSAENGDQWYRSNTGLADSNVIAMAIDSTGTMFTSTQSGLFKSSDGGSSWQLANNGLTSRVFALGFKASGNQYAATGSGVYCSQNSGESWSACSKGLPNDAVISVSCSENKLFAGTANSGIYCSTDSGANWFASNTGLLAKSIQSISVNSIKRIFIGSKEGIFLSTDSGITWASLNQGLTYSDVRSIVFDRAGYAYAATYGGGVFKTTETTTSVNEHSITIPKPFLLMQNFPNPFNPSTVIQYQLPINVFVTLKIYDVLGREVKTLINEHQSAGIHNITFDASNLASGIYFYRLQAGVYNDIKKLLLLK